MLDSTTQKRIRKIVAPQLSFSNKNRNLNVSKTKEEVTAAKGEALSPVTTAPQKTNQASADAEVAQPRVTIKKTTAAS